MEQNNTLIPNPITFWVYDSRFLFTPDSSVPLVYGDTIEEALEMASLLEGLNWVVYERLHLSHHHNSNQPVMEVIDQFIIGYVDSEGVLKHQNEYLKMITQFGS